MNEIDIKNIFIIALTILYEKEIFLIKNKCSERNIMAKLACILTNLGFFDNYNIDVEYNREGETFNSKRYRNIATTADLIIHTRGNSNSGNLIYLECKTYYNITDRLKDDDIYSIKYFINKFNYNFGIFLYLGENKTDCNFDIYLKNQTKLTFNLY